MDTARIRSLLDERDRIDRDLASAFNGNGHTKKAITCSVCNEEGHTARTCSKRNSGQSVSGDDAV